MARSRKPKAPKAGAQAPASGRPTHVVLRIIQGAEGGDIFAGTPEEPTFVDASDWANAALLEQTGHLRRVTLEEAEAFDASVEEGGSGAVPEIPKTHEDRLARLHDLDASIVTGDLDATAEAAARDEAARIERAILDDHLTGLRKAAAEGDSGAQAELDQYTTELKSAADEGDLAAQASLDRLASPPEVLKPEPPVAQPPSVESSSAPPPVATPSSTATDETKTRTPRAPRGAKASATRSAKGRK